jgi:hypothetical protein
MMGLGGMRRRPSCTQAVAFVALGLVSTQSCGGARVEDGRGSVRSLRDLADARLVELSTRRIFFGHQSVGGNIIDGLREVLQSDPRLALEVSESASALDGGRGALVHRRIGRNGDPKGKTDEFARLMEAGLGRRVDIALHKYCFADIGADTDVRTAFEHYQATMTRLEAEFPHVVFVHVTTPLVRVQSGLKAEVKELLGREPDHYADNFARERFNDLMREAYRGKEPLFDLAVLESTRPDGARETITSRGATSFAMVPAFTSDGGHLNEEGRRVVAQQLLVVLAGLPASR